MNAYLRAYMVHRRWPEDAFYAWRLGDLRDLIRARWGW